MDVTLILSILAILIALGSLAVSLKRERREAAEAVARRRARPVVIPRGGSGGPDAPRVTHEYEVINGGLATITDLRLWIEDADGKVISTRAGGPIGLGPNMNAFQLVEVSHPLPDEQHLIVSWSMRRENGRSRRASALRATTSPSTTSPWTSRRLVERLAPRLDGRGERPVAEDDLPPESLSGPPAMLDTVPTALDNGQRRASRLLPGFVRRLLLRASSSAQRKAGDELRAEALRRSRERGIPRARHDSAGDPMDSGGGHAGG